MDEIDTELINYMRKHGKVKAGELSDLAGISVPSIRVRLFQLMALGVVSKEKTRDHNVWFYVKEQQVEAPKTNDSISESDNTIKSKHKTGS